MTTMTLVKLLTIFSIILNPFSFVVNLWENPPEIGISVGSKAPIGSLTPQKLPLQDTSELANISYLVSQTNPGFLPIRDWSVDEPELTAQSVLILDLDQDKILTQKNIDQVLPVASLTKLMTALIVLENMDLEEIVTISQAAVEAYGDNGSLVLNEKISIKNLLYALLMESSNDAAMALAESFKDSPSRTVLQGQSLVSLMNQKAQELGLANTHFVEPTGFNSQNVSTVKDIAQLVKYSLDSSLIWQILKTAVIDVHSADGQINHHLVNSNQLLAKFPQIIGGKTGYIEEAGQCMFLVTQRDTDNKLIFVILASQDTFGEMERLVEWVEEAYIW